MPLEDKRPDSIFTEVTNQERYTMAEAAEKLGISNKTLVNWVNRGGLREVVERQVFEYDQRAHYLTRGQLEKIAKDHRRSLNLPVENIPPLPEEVLREQLARLNHMAVSLRDSLSRHPSPIVERRLAQIETMIAEIQSDLDNQK